jgi:hypothetical protein
MCGGIRSIFIWITAVGGGASINMIAILLLKKWCEISRLAAKLLTSKQELRKRKGLKTKENIIQESETKIAVDLNDFCICITYSVLCAVNSTQGE